MKVTFGVLQARLIHLVNERIQNGDFTERGLARLLGVSQPQIHNVLKGARRLRPELADRLIATLELTILDLLDSAELHEELLQRPTGGIDHAETPARTGSHLQPKRLKPELPKKPCASETPPPQQLEHTAS